MYVSITYQIFLVYLQNSIRGATKALTYKIASIIETSKIRHEIT